MRARISRAKFKCRAVAKCKKTYKSVAAKNKREKTYTEPCRAYCDEKRGPLLILSSLKPMRLFKAFCLHDNREILAVVLTSRNYDQK